MTDSYYLLERLCNLPGGAGFEGKQHLHPWRFLSYLTFGNLSPGGVAKSHGIAPYSRKENDRCQRNKIKRY